jgi:hypothetical protein
MKMEEKKYPPDMDGLVFSKEAFSQDKPNYNGTEKSKSHNSSMSRQDYIN